MNRYAMGGYQPLEADGIEPSVGWEQFPQLSLGFPPGEAKNSEDFGLYHSSKRSIA